MSPRPITKDRLVAGARRRVSDLRARFAKPSEDHETGDARVDGCVEEFSQSLVQGWVAVRADARPVRVSLQVNSLEVAATWASEPVQDRNGIREIRPFSFRLKQIWSFTKADHRVTVRVEGRPLPIAGHGMFFAPEIDGPRNLSALRRRFDSGHVMGQTGKLQLSKKLDTEWQGAVLGLYDRVRRVVADEFGYDVFFIYGTLLGAVREGGFISHDLDFDAAYLSRHTDGKQAAAELQQIAFTLIDHGFDVDCKVTALHIHDAESPATKIDLFHLYFDRTGNLAAPFGVAGTTDVPSSDWKGTKEIEFTVGRGLVPVNDEQIVEHFYGAGWRHPQPGFDWKRDRTKRALRGRMPPEYREEVYWANFYARHEFTSGSSFFEKVNARPDLPGNVIDIGCGEGRDSFAFGQAGRTVVGMDRADIAVKHASKKAATMGLEGRVGFVACDVGHDEEVRERLGAAIAAADGPVLFYLRFFLHSVPEDVQETLMRAISDSARPGDVLAAEFRTDKDEQLGKLYGNHYRRFQNGPLFGIALRESYGFEVLDEEEGTGLSVYQDEDPELYRVVARYA